MCYVAQVNIWSRQTIAVQFDASETGGGIRQEADKMFADDFRLD